MGEEDVELNVDTMSIPVFTEMMNLATKDSELVFEKSYLTLFCFKLCFPDDQPPLRVG